MRLNKTIQKRPSELRATRFADQGADRRNRSSNGAQTAKAAVSKRDGHRSDPEPTPQATAQDSSALKGIEVSHADGSAQHPAGTDREPSGSPDGVDHNDPERAQQAGSPPLQPIVAIAFPRCDAAVRNREVSEWALADAILAECSETGADGVKNHSYAKIEAMREEIAKNHGRTLTFERIRKLRKAGSAFPPGRRRPGVSLEGHLEAGTPEALDQIINNSPVNTAITRKFIRQVKRPDGAEQDNLKEERRLQVEDHRKALQDQYRQLERKNELLQQRYADLCLNTGKEPEPLPPPLPQEGRATRTVAEDLEHSLRMLLMSRGFDPTADNVKRAIQALVTALGERS
jgi:hypothetical protein